MNGQRCLTGVALVTLMVIVPLLNMAPLAPVSQASPLQIQACVTLQPDASTGKDAYIKEDRPTEKHGGDNEVRVKTESGKLNRSLLQFDVASILPPKATVTGATLSLYVKDATDNVDPVTINLHEVSAYWDEAEVTWNNRDAGVPWTPPGGDYDGTVVSSVAVNRDQKDTWVSWDVLSLASGWASDPATNYGLLLEAAVTDPKVEVKFKSSDDGTASQRPKLEVCYTLPDLTIDPDNEGLGHPGEVMSYGHTVANNTGAPLSVTASAVSSQGWAVQLFDDLNGNGERDGGEPDLTGAFDVAAGGTYTIGVEVTVPLGASDGTVDITTVTVTDGVVTDSATDTTEVCDRTPPVVDGLLDDGVYTYEGTQSAPDHGGTTAVFHVYSFSGCEKCCWALVVDENYNDNVVGPDDAYTALAGWGRSHTLGNLVGSDKATAQTCGCTYTFDYISYVDGQWCSGVECGDGNVEGDNCPPIESMTSMEYNLTQSTYGTVTNPPAGSDNNWQSPPLDYNCTNPDDYYEWRLIYEYCITKTPECSNCDEALGEPHNSPNKSGDYDEPSLAKIGDFVWYDKDQDGIQDGLPAGEYPLGGWTVWLYKQLNDGSWELHRTTHTDQNGYYLFSYLDPGTYYVDVCDVCVADYCHTLSIPQPPGEEFGSGDDPMAALCTGGTQGSGDFIPITVAAGDEYLRADFGYYQEPTGFLLASFSAAAQGQAIGITWQTASEVDLQGFNLYRAEAAHGKRTRLNEQLIPVEVLGSPVGATYQYTDTDVTAGLVYFYWLEQVAIDGSTIEDGPVSAELNGPKLNLYFPLLFE